MTEAICPGEMLIDLVPTVTGMGLDQSRDALRRDETRLVVAGRLSRGCCFFTPELRGEVETFKIDATRAGDGFVAGLLQELLKHPDAIRMQQELHDRCRFANAVGAISASGRGAIPALPDYRQVRKFLDENQ